MLRLAPWAAAALAVVLAEAPAAGEGVLPVSLSLVLAVDVSASVDEREFALQMNGTAQALRDPHVLSLIAGHEAGVAMTVVQWSAGYLNKQAVPWRLLGDARAVFAFADEVERSRRLNVGNYTAVGSAIDFSVRLIERSLFRGRERKIDLSGDGRNNSGPGPSAARDRAVERGITVNALAVLDGDSALDDYFAATVIGGPGAFVLPAESYDDFAAAMRAKLIRELSPPVAAAPPPRFAASP